MGGVMGLRFRKSIKIAPGIRLNVSNKSVGVSAGVKGARVSVNSSGRKTTTVGIPGTGLSYSTSSSSKRKKNSPNAAPVISYADLPTSTKSKKITLLLCIFLGIFGVHRFYTGKIGTGILWFVTVGFFFFGWLADIISILSGHFIDGNGNVIRQG